MKLLVLLALCACAFAAAPAPTKVNVVDQEHPSFDNAAAAPAAAAAASPERSSILINALVRQLIAYVRRVINNGSAIFGFGPLDPLEIDHLHLNIPAGLINLELELEDVLATGFGGFVVHTSDLNLRELTFTLDISVPRIDIHSKKYAFVGDLFGAIPLYGNGEATFVVENFRLRATLHLKQSDDENSILIDRIEGAGFEVPHLESNLTGAIGGGDIDHIVNAIVEEVLVDYVNRFHGVIALGASHAIIHIGNPILGQLDTWKFIAPFV